MSDQIGKLMRRHANVQDELLIIAERPLNVVNLLLLELDSQRFLNVVLELRIVELLTHVDVPIRLGHHTRDKPVGVVEIFLVTIASLRVRQWAKEVGKIEVRLQFLVGQVVTCLNLGFRKDVWLGHVLHNHSVFCAALVDHLMARVVRDVRLV